MPLNNFAQLFGFLPLHNNILLITQKSLNCSKNFNFSFSYGAMLYQSKSKTHIHTSMRLRWAADRLNSWHTRLHKSYESFRLAGKFVAWVFCLFIFSLPTEEKLRLKTEKRLSWFVVPSNGFQLLPRWVSHWGVFNVNWLLYSTGHWASPCWHLHILPPINVSSYIYI